MILVVFLCALTIDADLLPSAKSGTEKDASFTQVKYSSAIRVHITDKWTFTVHNTNCTENDRGEARFFLKFYIDTEEWWDEYNTTTYRTWNCSKGQTVSHSYEVGGWSAIQPVAHDMRIALYSFVNGTAHLEDTTSFRIAVTVPMSFQHIYAIGYLAAYLLACFFLLSYDYVLGLEE